MKTTRPLFFAALGASLLCAHTLLAFVEPAHGPLPNFDKREEKKAVLPHSKTEGAAHLRKQIPAARVEFDPIIGAPRWVSAPDGFLTGPNGRGRGISAQVVNTIPANDPHFATRAFLKEHRGLFGHGSEVLDTAPVKREFTTPHNGMKTVVWEQQVDNISVFEALLVSHTTKKGELVNLASHFLPDPIRAADAGGRNRAALIATPPITAQEAVVKAAENLGEELALSAVAAVDVKPRGAEKHQRFHAPGLKGEIHARLIWLPMNDALMRLCWEVILTSHNHGEMFRVLIDAQTGEVLVRHCLTNYLSNATYRVFPSDSPAPFSPGHPTPLSSQPALTSRVLVVTNAFNTNASPNGWIADADNETRGNNVDAHLDRNDDDQPDLPRPQGSPFRVFDFSMDLSTQDPTNYGSAAVTQLFFLCNWYHDKLYEFGFTEAAGNFQVNNFGRGGLGNDAVLADAQDGGGTDNANFATPPDGQSGRMQMYIFSGSQPRRDGDFDAEIVFHEFTHGLSNRRVGNGVGISALQSAGMGEGWSDFYALCLLSEPTDDIDGVYAAGGYATYQFFGLTQNYYYGIRHFPYTTDMSKNPFTFKDIDRAQVSPHTGVPRSPIYPFDSREADEVHHQGEVWCVTLWQARANLIRKYGFAIGNNLILQLVTDGMNLSPANPNFLEARDAIIQADRVNNGGANYNELWAAFAKRGMGFFASSPSSSTTAGVIESFDLPDDSSVLPRSGFSARGPVGGPFDQTSQNYSIGNLGTNVLMWAAGQTANWLDLSQTNGTLNPGDADTVMTVSLNAAANSLSAGIYTNNVRFTNLNSGIVQSRAVVLNVGPPDFYTELFESSVDVGFQTFTFTPDESSSFYTVCRSFASSFPTDPAGGTTVTMADDSFASVSVTGGNTIAIYGKRTNLFYLCSNGFITVGASDTNYFESITAHFQLPRISALFHDLNPASSGTISRKQLSDRVAVTFSNVPEYGVANVNNFQIELFFNGTIRLTYLQVDSFGALVGLSEGKGVPPGFTQSDFSSYGCTYPLKLTVPAGANETAGVLPGQGSVSIRTALPTDLSVDLLSTDTSEVTVPANVIIPAGQTNAVFDVTIVDDADLDGTQIPIIRASAQDYSTPTKPISVFDNETAALSMSFPGNVAEGNGTAQGTVTMNAVPADNIVVTLTSSDTTEIQTPASVVIPAGQTSAMFPITVVDDAQIDGTQNVTLTAHVANWTDGTANTTVADNENNLLTLLLPAQAIEGNGLMSGSGVVKISGTLSNNLVVSLSSTDTTELTVPASATILAGQTSALFNLTVVDDTLLDGTQPVTISASATGFVNTNGVINIFDDETAPALTNLFPPHLSSNNPVTVDLAWLSAPGEGIEQLANGGFETGDFTGWTRQNTSLGNFVINDGTFNPPSPDASMPPYAGSFSALGQQNIAGPYLMYQDVTISTNVTLATLSWMDRIRNFSTAFATNQQFRVEIRNTNNATLAVIFSTKSGDPLLGEWTQRAADLINYRGQRIRVTFIVDALSYLDVHLDNVSLRTGTPPPTTYDVYFGTNPVPGAAELLGSTTNRTWDLPLLSMNTYYWQIMAHRTGTTTGPVWQFTTVPTFFVSDATVTEGNSGITNLLFNVTLSVPLVTTASVNFATADGTAVTPADYVSTNGLLIFAPGETNKSISVAVKGDTVYELNETFLLNLSNPTNAVIGRSGVATIVNDDPLLPPISDKTVVEGNTLTFTVTNNSSSTSPVQVITDFESFTNGTSSVMFRNPRFSPSTTGYLDATPDSAAVTSTFPSGNQGARVVKASWSFNTTTINQWVRLTTSSASSFPNPTISFTQALRFDMYTDKAVRVGLGVRETSTTNTIGADGGVSGNIEWLGATTVTNGIVVSPVPSRTITAGSWQTVTFNVPGETVRSFTGNGVLDSTTGKGVLEHLVFAPAGGTGTYNVYLDNVSVVSVNGFTYSLSNAPAGASINPYTGVFTWTPTEAQGPGVYSVTVFITDNGSPAQSDSRTFQVTVLETNSAPVLNALGTVTVNENTTLTFTATASDPDIPTNTLTFSIDPGAPAGASINAINGIFTWMPSEHQGPSTNTIVVRVTDNGSPNLSATRTFTAIVNEVNSAPVLSAISDRTIYPNSLLTFTASASDADFPANTLSFSLDAGAPSGATINSSSGVFNWTPTDAQAGSSNVITVRVTDNGVPPQNNAKNFSVFVLPLPVIQSIAVSNGVVTLSWSSVPGKTYRVQSKPSLETSGWNDVAGDVTATGSIASKQDVVNATTQRFYRIVLLP